MSHGEFSAAKLFAYEIFICCGTRLRCSNKITKSIVSLNDNLLTLTIIRPKSIVWHQFHRHKEEMYKIFRSQFAHYFYRDEWNWLVARISEIHFDKESTLCSNQILDVHTHFGVCVCMCVCWFRSGSVRISFSASFVLNCTPTDAVCAAAVDVVWHGKCERYFSVLVQRDVNNISTYDKVVKAL